MAPRYSEIGDAIRSARQKKKLSQDELARRVGARGGRQTVIRWEQGLHKPTDYVDGLCRELDLNESLFGDEAADEPLSRDETTQLFSLLGKAMGVRA